MLKGRGGGISQVEVYVKIIYESVISAVLMEEHQP